MRQQTNRNFPNFRNSAFSNELGVAPASPHIIRSEVIMNPLGKNNVETSNGNEVDKNQYL